ncbi:helicase Required for RNAi-mediated heterochromatin assembly Hrr1 [Schizosaccharomyces cryophilus OY26]|uniref:Helicase Required for RNAi-mediated heterochromatin assembly Hrr1 n=1 Tax=Schizosaccharomyces cryophilus (strain OY26 / ATCC MYA-4695 / CBS 11777 / NBRC 106824 / NRRL Y48691) TaxID=653667 RepID=S9VZI2_SCHCR|nr:helicase Required for RNAi-mediated heterochromatin assembly Hrr1 [Schizosaccharomyces cryophilus OY26]EPY51210.1 helicase Required for RNAi-mediated heterochromatin assembly Hrr1 [Schizosaccharomyces cryophilus OY26]
MEEITFSEEVHNPWQSVEASTLEMWDQQKNATDAEEVVFDDIPDETLIHQMKTHQEKRFGASYRKSTIDEVDVKIENCSISPKKNGFVEGRTKGKSMNDPVSLDSKVNADAYQHKVPHRPNSMGKEEQGSHWRSLPSIPTFEELSSASVDLPENDVFGRYKDFDHYLSVHYTLLREDAISPLRESVLRYKKDPTSISSPSFAVYDHVRVVGHIIATGSVVSKLSFSVRAQKRIPWATSRRLISGSIVLLSEDNFEHFRVGTVCARPLSGLKKYPHEVDVFFNDLNLSLDSRKEFVMIEATSGYWEAYKHVLSSLQKLSVHHFPMKDYFVSCKRNSEIARYVQHNPLMRINSILGSSQPPIDILEPFPSYDDYLLDKSQLKAFQSMLTKKLALVQGPPGTGKTFVALKAIQILLENSNSNVLPILVACQTNHAVDQILLQLLHEGASVVRLGSRTQVPEIKAVSVFERIKSTRNTFRVTYNDIRKKKGRLMKQMLNIMSNFSGEFVKLTYLHSRGIITTAQLQSLVENSGWVNAAVESDEATEEEQIECWLGETKLDLITPTEIVDGYEEELQIEAEQLEELEQEAKEDPAFEDDELHGIFRDFKRKYDFCESIKLHLKELKSFLATENIWDIPEFSRGIVYKHWLQLAYEDAEFRLKRLHNLYRKADEERINCTDKRVAALLRGANVIGMTTTGLNKYRSILENIRPKICFIEEAANILEGPIVPAVFPSLEQLILIGDHKQLRPSCSTFALAKAPFNLSVSMFERLVENNMVCDMLSVQRRMHPQIRKLIDSVYIGLSDHIIAKGRSAVPGMGQLRRFFFTHAGVEETDFASKFNVFEAEMLVQFASYLINHGVNPLQITCLTFYAAQKKVIDDLLARHLPINKENIRVATVDGYQGEENDVILLSLVRNHDQQTVGFLVSSYRVCVALSRARRGLYIFGNAEMVATANPLWWDVINTLTQDEELPGLGDYLPLEPKIEKEAVYINDPNDLLELNMKLKNINVY